MANLFEPTWSASVEREGFTYRDSWLAHQAGSRRLGASLYEVEPGQATFPYHWHSANEELLVVVEGTVAVRTPKGTREAGAGEVIAFPRGEDGAHQIVGAGDRAARFLVLSEMNGPDIYCYPDSGKVGFSEGAPGSGAAGLRMHFVQSDAVDYWHGELPPR